MSAEPPFAAIGAWLTARSGRRFDTAPAAAVHGGSVHRCLRWPGRGGDAFVKLARADGLASLEAEADGLAALRAAGALRVPDVYAVGLLGDLGVLALEWLDLAPAVADRPEVQARLGAGLAALHRVIGPRHGWPRDNWLGAAPQPNGEDDDWLRFFRRRRLAHQLDCAARCGLPADTVARGRELVERCDGFFAGHRPEPSLLHGDLWGGNRSALATGVPVVFDPAVHRGDRETDLAFTRLFGGFGPAFYVAYDAAWPPAPGADARRTLYNLVHVLNHYALFGGGYGQQARAMIERLLAELG